TPAPAEKPGWSLWGSSPGQTANVGFVFVNGDGDLVTGMKLIVYRFSDSAVLATLSSGSDGRVYVWSNVPSDDRNDAVDVRFDNPDWWEIGFGPVPWNWAEAADAFFSGFSAYRVVVKHIDPQPDAPEEP